MFDYIEFFYNPKRKHGNNGILLLIEFEWIRRPYISIFPTRPIPIQL
ncbi:MAG: hypothetical protein COB54_00115 [Alphaproteobacteria bacterium]|nr:MAG: hypothetical protein COB54_00115 [Alphaproteobacteria bacterium]